MESEPLELAEQDSYADYGNYAHYANYAHQPAEDQDYVNTVNPRIANHSQEIRGGSPGNQNEENTRLFRSIVKQYGPKEQKEHKHSIEQRQQKFSFQPEISEMPREIYGDVAEKLEITKEEQWERILKPKNETIQERERQKYEKEAKDIQENCTFQPNISSTYELSASKYNVTNTLPTTDRLYKEGIEKLKTKEIERRRTDGLDECTFQPDVAKSTQVLKGEKLTEKPLYTRLGDIMKQKQEFLQKIRIEAEQSNKDLAFKPKLNEHSNILADAKQQIRDVTDRLMKDAADKIYKKMKQAEEYEEKLTSVCTFKPNVNPISRSNDEILARNDFYAIQKDTVTRQYLMADKQRENLQKKAKEIMEKEGCTFAPQINKISQFLIEADPQRANENLDEKVERLSKLDAQKKEIIQEQMKKAHYEKFTFKPEINKISKDIGKKATLEELAYNLEAKEHLQILREKSIDNMLTECSFKPTINRKKKYENVEPYFKEEGQIMDNVSLLSKKKEIKYDQQRKIEEYDEMKECTFKPRIKGDIDEESLRPKLGQKVAGIDKFMQVRDKHKRQKEEQRKREEEVFDIAKKYSMEKHEGFTVQQPFKLSKGSKDSIRNARAAQELREKFEKEHPFKPMTNEGKNREIINKAIANGERVEYSY